MGRIPDEIDMSELHIKKHLPLLGLYVGIGYKINGVYIHLPKFIKRSPFNLIFKDLTNGGLPKLNADNISFSLSEFDVI